MNPGLLDKRITILDPSETTENVLGEEIPIIGEVDKVWAKVEALKGKEYLEAQKIRSELTYRVTIRYRKDIHPAMIIRCEDKELEVQSAIEVGRKKYLELICIEKVK